ncbi:hypothetical protein TFLX_03411 [Thermoflexales bacterium]|nr:hypothetical protein TFLX_03411 [Thermoflexales bacterium]
MSRKFLWMVIITCAGLLFGCREWTIPRWTEIAIPETTLQPTSTITLTIEDGIGPLSVAREKAAVAWSIDGINYQIGTFDINQHSIRPSGLLISPVSGDQQSSRDLIWSPTGKRLLYLRDDLYPWPNWIAYVTTNAFIFSADNPRDAQRMGEGRYAQCGWSPDGQYVFCNAYCGPSSGGGGDIVDIYDAATRSKICEYGYVGCSGIARCPPLQLTTGEIWNLPDVRKFETPTAAISEDAQAAIVQLCQRTDPPKTNLDVTVFECSDASRASAHFVAIRLNQGLFVADLEQWQIWKVGNKPSYHSWNWSADGRYLAWIEEGQVRVFDTATHTTTIYIAPDAQMLNIAWPPLR